MRTRSFLFLLAVTVIMLAAAVYAVASGDRAVSAGAHDQRMFPELAARLDSLAWMRVSRGAMKADLNLVGGRWAVVEKGNYPAAAGIVHRLLVVLAELTLVEPKTSRPELFGRLDLDDPSSGKATLVSLQDRTGETVAELIVGKTRRDRLGAGEDGVYVRKPVADRAWLARGSLDLPGDVAGWLDRRIVDLAASRVASVALSAIDGGTLTFGRDAPGQSFMVTGQPEEAKVKSEATLAEAAAALAGLDLDDVKPSAELPVPENDAATASFATFDGLTVTLRLFVHDKAEWAAVAASGTGAAEKDAAAINAKVGRWVYAIPASRAKLLRLRLADVAEPGSGS